MIIRLKQMIASSYLLPMTDIYKSLKLNELPNNKNQITNKLQIQKNQF